MCIKFLISLTSIYLLATAPTLAEEPNVQANIKLEKLIEFATAVAKGGCSKTRLVVSNEAVTNLYDPNITDQIQTVACQNLYIRYYVAYAHTPPAKILDSVEIVNQSMKLPLGLTFGMTSSDIQHLLGSPDFSKPNSITYFAPESEGGGSDGITFIFKQGKLNKFVVSFHYE